MSAVRRAAHYLGGAAGGVARLDPDVEWHSWPPADEDVAIVYLDPAGRRRVATSKRLERLGEMLIAAPRGAEAAFAAWCAEGGDPYATEEDLAAAGLEGDDE